jgi:hypothetical protein
MGKIVIQENVFSKTDVRTFAHKGPYIDFLVKHYPIGFSGPHVTLRGLNKVPVYDYDFALEEDDEVVLAIAPADPGSIVTAIVYALVSAAVSTALNYAINSLYGDKGTEPSDPAYMASLPDAGSVYSMSVPTNMAKLGNPIPVAYGRNPLVPDLASQPYSYYYGNEQFVVMLLCLGQGYFEIHDVMIADTSADTWGGGVVSKIVASPSEHQQQFGFMQNAIGYSSTYDQVFENVYTSVEVSDQELFAAAGAQYVGTAYLYNGKYGDSNRALFQLGATAFEYAEAIAAGRPVYLIVYDSGADDGIYQVAYIAREGEDGAGVFGVKGTIDVPGLWPTSGITANIKLSYNAENPETPGGAVGPYTATPSGTVTTLLQYDLNFPSGCYAVGPAGELSSFYVTFTFVAQQIDDDGNVLPGTEQEYIWAEYIASNTPQRRTVWHYVPSARYRVTAYRGSFMSDKASDMSLCYWVGLKSVLGNTTPSGGDVYGDVTLMLIKMKASEGVASDALNQVSVDATRLLNDVATSNPIAAFRDIYTNRVYGGRRPPGELDLDRLNDLRVQWAMEGRKFEAVFDQTSTVWEAMNLALQLQFAAVSSNGSLITIVEDLNHTVPYYAFDESSISAISFSYLFSEPDDYDGVEGEYRDPITNGQLYAMYPTTADNPEQVTLWGCRDRLQAEAYVERRWKQKLLRRRLVSFDVELEGNIIPVGEPISIQHRLTGSEPVLYVVSSVTPKDEFAFTIEAIRHEPGVFT